MNSIRNQLEVALLMWFAHQEESDYNVEVTETKQEDFYYAEIRTRYEKLHIASFGFYPNGVHIAYVHEAYQFEITDKLIEVTTKIIKGE